MSLKLNVSIYPQIVSLDAVKIENNSLSKLNIREEIMVSEHQAPPVRFVENCKSKVTVKLIKKGHIK